jgi:CelD/BcsL family acetyltransferase involved in cellulose biosynthesis
MSYTITLTHDPARLAALRGEWEALQQRNRNRTLYQTWAWVSTWWAHFGQPDALWLVEARAKDGRLAGLAPLMLICHHPLAGMTWRQIQFIGASAALDHLDFIIEDGAEPAIIPLILARLRAENRRWDTAYFSALAEDSPTPGILRGQGIPWREEEPICCPAIVLPESWEAFHASLPKRKRRNLRRAHARLDEEHPGGWCAERVSDPAAVEAMMAEMMRLHQEKWHALGKPGGFPDEQAVAFHQAIAARMAARGWLWLFRLVIGEAVAAIEYAYAFDGRVYAYASGVNFALADYSPGQVLMEHMIGEAIRQGMHTYDFLRGDEEYKFFWQAECRYDSALRWLASSRARHDQALIDLAGAAWRQSKVLLPKELRRRLRHVAKGEPYVAPEEADADTHGERHDR